MRDSILETIKTKYNEGQRPIKLSPTAFKAYWDYLCWDKFDPRCEALAFKDTVVIPHDETV